MPKESISAAPPLETKIPPSASRKRDGQSHPFTNRFHRFFLRESRLCASVPNRTLVRLHLAAAIAIQNVPQRYPVYKTTASKLPREISRQTPGFNRPRNDPKRGVHE